MTDKSMAKEILPNTIGSREFIKAITQFSDVWLTQTKNVEAKKRKDAAKQKRKAISGKKVPASENVSSSTSEPDPGPWNPESKTTIGRVSYKIKEFPALMVAKLEFVYLESGSISSGNDVWQTLYPRKYRTEALSELLNNDFKEFKNVVAVNEAVGAKDLEDHLIVPAHSLRSEWLLKLQPRNIDLTESKQYVNDNTTQAIRCKITGLHGYTSRDLNTGPYQRSLLCLLHERITSVAGAGTTYEYLKDVSGPMAGTTKYRSIPRLISGWEMLLPPSPKLSAAHSLIGSAPVLDITLRGKMSIDRKRKLLNIDVDLAAIVGRSERVSNLIVDIFGNNITAHNVQRLKPTIADILVGLTVHRAYEATTTTTEKSQQTWYDPFQVREVLFNEEVMKRSGKSNFDTLAYFKNNYDDKANYEYLPLVGDGKGGFFPLQLVAISTRQAFPRANVLTPALKAKILSLRLTSQNSSATHEMLEALGKEFIDKALAPRTFAEDNVNHVEDHKLFEVVDEVFARRLPDPIDFVL